ncbi:MAG TPA: family 10 glycosylhydrolase [Armatimonadota bacterium]|jgi:uncharacterized lipoprotein YddW (UPF0748 family)
MMNLRWLPFVLLCSLGAASAQTPEYRAQWADAFNSGFLSAAQVTTMVGNVRAGHGNVIIPEVRVYADAYFAPTPAYYANAGTTINANGVRLTADLLSQPEPRKSSSYDALQEVITKAHDTSGGKQRLDVWAWLVSFRTGTVLKTAHPGWLTQKADGTVVDTDFDPGHPGVEQQFYNVCMDLVDHYGVDGLHFDYIRFTASDNGYNPVSVARFNARYGRTGTPLNTDAAWQQWRRDQVTACVRKVYLNAIARRPAVRLSAATITFAPGPARPTASDTNPTQTWKTNFQGRDAYKGLYQDWRGWMQEGILDISIPMAYFGRCSYEDSYEKWMDFTKENQFGRQGMIGPGVYLNTPADDQYQLEATRWPSTPGGKMAAGQSLYSYATPYADSCYGTGVKDPAGMAAMLSTGSLTDGTVITSNPLYPTTTPLPALPRLTNGKGHLKGTVTDATCPAPGWVDGATVTLTATGFTTRSMRTDGTGFFGFVDVPPGTYTLTAAATGLASQSQIVYISAGNVTTQDFSLAQNAIYTTAFTTHPGGAVANKAFATQPVVMVRDSGGNVVTGYAGPVTLAIKSGTGSTGAALLGTATVNAAAGVAAFSGVGIDTAGTDYVLTAAANQASPADSTAFDVAIPISDFGSSFTKTCTVVPGAAATGYSGIAVNRNAASPYYGYVYAAEKSAEHKIRIYRPNPEADRTSAAAYVDTGLRIRPTSVTGNNPWDVAIGPDDTVWVMNLDLRTIETAPPVPAGSATEVATVKQIDVAALSGAAIGASGPRGLAVRGPVAAASVYVSLTGGGGGFFQKYSVAASDAGTAGTAALAWSVAGSNLTYGVAVDPQGNSYWPIPASPGAAAFTKLDASGAVQPFGAAIPAFFTASLSVGDAEYVADASRPDGGFLATYSRARSGSASASNPDRVSGHRFAMDGSWLDGFGPAMAGSPIAYAAIPIVAAGTSDTTGSSGSAQYAAVDDEGSFYASCKDAYPAGNTAFVKIGRVPQAVLGIAAQPMGARAGQPFDTQPKVDIRDASGTALNVAGPVTLSIKPGTGTPGAALIGAATVNAYGGEAQFSGLGIDKAGAGYVLVASCSSLPSAETAPLTVAQVAVGLTFTAQPAGAIMGLPFASQPVITVHTSEGSVATEYTGPVTLELASDLGSPGASLLGASTVSAVGGVASFTNLGIDTPGTGYMLVASSAALYQAFSNQFDVGLTAYTAADAARALRIWAGFDTASPRDAAQLDSWPNNVVDLADAVRIARKAAGIEPNP